MDKNKLKYYLAHEEELPEFVYAVNDIEGTVIILKKKMGGYFPSKCDIHGIEEAKIFVKNANAGLGLDIEEEQVEAMKIKSMGQWK